MYAIRSNLSGNIQDENTLFSYHVSGYSDPLSQVKRTIMLKRTPGLFLPDYVDSFKVLSMFNLGMNMNMTVRCEKFE